MPTAGDVVLRFTVRRLIAALVAPCLFQHGGPALAEAPRLALAGTGALARGRDFPVAAPLSVRPLVWLLLVALVLLGLEQFFRRVGIGATASVAAEDQA